MNAPGLFSRLRTAVARAIAPQRVAPRRGRDFAAASFNRASADWIMATMRSADQETRADLRTLRNRARELDRNSPWGARYSTLIAENVVGAEGFQLKAKNYLKDGTDYHRGANAGIESAWKDWSRPANCDVTGKYTLTENLSLAASQWATDGEILIRLWEGERFGPYGFKIQILDPDYLDETLNQVATGSLPLISQGVELDEFGKPVAYHLWTRHPADALFDRTRVRVPADQVIHAFIARRSGATRGIPHLAAIMATLKMLDGYVEAEIVAARTASASMGSLEDIPQGDAPPVDPNPDSNGEYDGAPGQSAIPAEATPGSLLDLRGMGARLSLWDPQHPTSAFPDFTKMMGHYAAMGTGLSYASLTGDYTQANYGSQRVAMLAEQTHWRRFQGFIVDHVLDLVFRRWLRMALLYKQIPQITDYDATRWTRNKWIPVGFDWIDPLKELQAELLEIGAGFSSPQRACARRGDDFEDMLEDIAEARDLIKAYGLSDVIRIGAPEQVLAAVAASTPDEPAKDKEDPSRNFRRLMRKAS